MITNTAKDEQRPQWLLGGNPQAIEAQEARGQNQLVTSAQLPVKIHGDKKSLEDAGIKFGPPTPGGELFCSAELPVGWKKEATDHTMWSNLVDNTGKVRAAIFYKAAFYDRSAFMEVSTH